MLLLGTARGKQLHALDYFDNTFAAAAVLVARCGHPNPHGLRALEDRAASRCFIDDGIDVELGTHPLAGLQR
jgi:hypothetical protein